MHIFLGFLYGLLAQVLTFIQLQGPLKWELAKQNRWFLMLFGIPVSALFMESVRHFVLAFGGQIWPSRLIGFSIGILVFTIMSHALFNEHLSVKTGVCLVLGFAILMIQIFWK